MSVLSVRLPQDLDRLMPRKARSTWVIDAIRQRLRRERIEAIAASAAEHANEELQTLEEWTAAAEPLKTPQRSRRRVRI